MAIQLPDVSNEIRTFYQSRVKDKGAVYGFRASSIGDPCDRYLYHLIKDWHRAKPITGEKQGLFLLGEHLEDHGINLLKRTGWKIHQSPDTQYWREKHISGKVDAFGTREDLALKQIPIEIKFLGEYSEAKNMNWKEMLKADRRWIRRYPGQLLTYMLLRNALIGLFLSFSKMDADPEHIWFNLDEDVELLEYGEYLIKRAETLWEHMETEIPPDRISPQELMCFDCEFITVCLPPMWFGPEARFMENCEALERKLDRRNELAPYSKEYNKLNEELKKIFNGVPSAVVGSWIVQGKEVERKGYEVAATTYWKWEAKRIGRMEDESKL
jgi:hypothetical protein